MTRIGLKTGHRSYATEILADSPALYWKCDETSGTTLVDSSGNGRDGTLTGSYALAGAVVQGSSGRPSLNLTGGYASWTPGVSLTGPYTVTCLINPSNLGSSPLLAGARASGDFSWQMGLTTSGGNGVAGTGAGWLTTGAGLNVALANSQVRVMHYVVTATDYFWYCDGSQRGSGSYSSGTPLVFDATHTVHLGWNGRGGEPTFQGLVSDFAIFPSALSAARIMTHARSAR